MWLVEELPQFLFRRTKLLHFENGNPPDKSLRCLWRRLSCNHLKLEDLRRHRPAFNPASIPAQADTTCRNSSRDPNSAKAGRSRMLQGWNQASGEPIRAMAATVVSDIEYRAFGHQLDLLCALPSLRQMIPGCATREQKRNHCGSRRRRMGAVDEELRILGGPYEPRKSRDNRDPSGDPCIFCLPETHLHQIIKWLLTDQLCMDRLCTSITSTMRWSPTPGQKTPGRTELWQEPFPRRCCASALMRPRPYCLADGVSSFRGFS
ncbi:hypothetical protein QBC36DRAFT_475 [Triangularia setosa]|uniref:Uncharacterized protein n=1 Tax=Triangularia setosa TaxID=2587417 RepID=A0AAN7ADB4_9PEZI|nr:hypothetical protein QBC36DRAFT_475 [Podospora setosa]